MQIIIPIIGLLLIVGGYVWMSPSSQTVAQPAQEVVAAVAEVITPVYVNASAEKIVIDTPAINETVQKKIIVKGKARGLWYFEASFPATLLDANNAPIAQGVGLAEGEWMTEDFVAYTVELTAPQAYSGPATIVLQRDNPSGEPQNDASISIPVTIQ